MKFPNIKTLFIAGLIVGTSSTAFAQDGFEFGGAEAAQNAAAAGPSPVSGALKEGIRLFGQKNYLEAAQKFYEVSKNESPAAAKDVSEARYRLAVTLYHLKLYQSSLSYFEEIAKNLDKTDFGPQALSDLAKLGKEIGDDPSLGQILKAYIDTGAYDLSAVSKEFQDQFAYLVGRNYLQMSEEEANIDANNPSLLDNQTNNSIAANLRRFSKAAQFLSQVKKTSPEYANAQYLLGVCNAKLGNLDKALENFKNSLRILAEKRKSSSLTYDEKRFFELGYLALARVYYAAGKFNTAIKNYSKIDRSSSNWPVALYESAWAYINLNNFDKALSNLQTVNSPFFSDRYFPQVSKIAALVYFYNCRYDRVRSILDDFKFEYEPLLATLDQLRNKYSTDLVGAFNWLINAKTKGVDKQLERVIDYAFSDVSIRRNLDRIVALNKELEAFGEMPEEFQQSSYGEALKKKIDGIIQGTQFDIGTTIVARLNDIFGSIDSLLTDVDKISKEISAAERRQIDGNTASIDNKVAQAETKDSKMKTTSEELVWTFDGEYWRDELGYYVIRVESQCKR